MKKVRFLTLMLVGTLMFSLATNAQSAGGNRQTGVDIPLAAPSGQGPQPVVWDATLPPGSAPANQGAVSVGTATPAGSALAAPAFVPQPIILDDFNRPDGPLGSDWTVHDGSCSITGNMATCGGEGRATFDAPAGNGYAVEADVAVNGSSTQYVALLLNYGAGVNNLFIKVQQQVPSTTGFNYAACYRGNNNYVGFGLGFFPLSSTFSTAHMKVTRVGNDVTVAFTNVDGGTQPDQIYVCSGAPAPEGNRIGIAGYDGNAYLDNFGVPGDDRIAWDKFVNGQPWHPGITVTVQTSDTIVVQDVLHLLPNMLPTSMRFEPVQVGGAPNANPAAALASPPVSPARLPESPASPHTALWDQPLSAVNQSAYVDQEFPDLPSHSSFLADDFVNDQPWGIHRIFIPGDGWTGFTSLMNATDLTWQIYADCGGVPCGDPSGGGSPPIWTLTLPPGDPQVTLSPGTPGGLPSNTTLILSTPITLPPGHWWLVFWPEMAFGTDGQYGRQPADTSNGHTGQFINPGGGFGHGTAWQNWTVIGPAQQDIAFRLEGGVLPWSGRLYMTSLNIAGASSDSFSVYDVARDSWTSLTPYETGCQMAVSQQGDLYAYGYATNTIDVYDPETVTWSPVMAAPPGAVGQYCNLEITNDGEFIYSDHSTTLWYTSGGVWNTLTLPFSANAMGDYDPSTDQYVIGEWQTTNAHLINVHTWTITNFTSSVFNGEWARFGVVMSNRYYFHAHDSNIFSFDLSNPSSAPLDHGVNPGWYNSAAADRSQKVIYTASLDGSTLARFAPATDTLTPLTGHGGIWHSSLAFVPAPTYSHVETWDPSRLQLVAWTATAGQVSGLPGYLTWSGEIITSTTITITKWFHIEPCNWVTATLSEELVLNSQRLEQRLVEVHKILPDLQLGAAYNPHVVAGGSFDFTFVYTNTGGYDSAAWVRAVFPAGAPFVSSVPPPTNLDPNGLWAEWDLGGLPMGSQGSIAVNARLEAGVPVSSTFSIVGGLYNHAGELADEVTMNFHVEPFSIGWEKRVDGVPWAAGMQITRQTSDTIVVQDVLHIGPPAKLGASMPFEPAQVSGGPTANPGIALVSPLASPAPLPRLPFSPSAVLWDQPLSAVNQNAYVDQEFPDYPNYSSFLADDFANAAPWQISVIFIPADGWNGFTSLMNATDLTWQIYADCGGAPCGDPSGGGSPPVWTLTLLPGDPQVTLSPGTPGGLLSNTTLTLSTPITLPPGHWWLIFWPEMAYGTGGQYGRQPADTSNGHTGQFINPGGGFGHGTAWQNWTVIGALQHDIAFTLAGQTVQESHVFTLTEDWDASRLHLTNWTASAGAVALDPLGGLTWSGEFSQTMTITLTKWLRLEPCTWTQTILTETLEIDAVEFEQRLLTINKTPPNLWIDATFSANVLPGAYVSYTLLYGNTGGYENAVRIRNTFPAGAPFVSSVPPPTSVDPNGLWAEWNIGNLPSGSQGSISVTVQVRTDVPFGSVLQIWDGIYNHVGTVADEVSINLQVALRKLFLPLIRK